MSANLLYDRFQGLTDVDWSTFADQEYPRWNATTGKFEGAAVSGAVGANPSASVALSVVNGVATTFMRSDAAPPLSQAIAPTWTQQHQFTPANGLTNAVTVNTWTASGAAATALTVNASTGAAANYAAAFMGGPVGIGTTAPVAKLAVTSGITIGATYAGLYAPTSNGLLVEGNVGIGVIASFPLELIGGANGSAVGPLLVRGLASHTIGVAFTLDAVAGGGKVYSYCATGPAAAAGAGAFTLYNGTDARYDFTMTSTGHWNFARNFYTDVAQLTVIPTASTVIGQVIRGAASQSANLQEWQNSAGTALAVVDASGKCGIGAAGGPDRLLHAESSTALTNTISYVQRLSHVTSGIPAAGIGLGLEFEQETSANNNEVIAIIEAVTTDVTATSEDGDLVFKVMAAGAAAAEQFRIASDGGLFAQTLLQQSAAGLVVEWDSTTKELYAETSSLRFKEQVEEYVPRCRLSDLRPKRWRDKATGRREIGLIAEDVFKLLPDLVVCGPDGLPLGVKYHKLAVLLLERVQQLERRLENAALRTA